MVIETYGYTSCSSCRKTEGVLKDAGIGHVFRDYFRDRFSYDELVSLLERAGLTSRQVLSKRSKVYQARAEEIDRLDDDALVRLMLEEPTLLRRPIVVRNGDVIIGHNPSQLAEMISSAD